MIFRRFSFLQARVLLHLQGQLQKYERELDLLDMHSERVHSTQASDEVSRTRFALLQKIEEKFEKYSKFSSLINKPSYKS